MKRSGLRRNAPPPRVTRPLQPLPEPAIVRPFVRETFEPIGISESTRVPYAERERDWDFMGFVKTMPCAVLVDPPTGVVATPCRDHIEADHQGPHAAQRKAADDTCVAMCDGHHDERHDRPPGGTFTGMSIEREREWRNAQIERTQRAYADHRAGRVTNDGVPF